MNFEDWPAGVHPLRKDFDIKTKPPRVEVNISTAVLRVKEFMRYLWGLCMQALSNPDISGSA